MSLTSIISDKRFQELRDKFKTVFPRPQINLTGELVAPPQTNNHSIVGQAFDYLFRFTLEQRHKAKVKSWGGWVADSSYRMITQTVSATNSKTIMVGYRRDIPKDRKEFLKMLETEYSNAKQNYQKYLADGILTDDIIKSALYLSRLDVTFRAGMIDSNLGNESEHDIKDVRQLISVINHDHFKVDNHCFLNPTFGHGSQLVGGADADLIIDDTLIDIKVSKNLAVERDHLNQTIGYYILSLIGGVNNDENFKPIKNVGLYFARHGVLWKVPLSTFADEKTFLDFKDWFITYIEEKVWQRSGLLDKIKSAKADRQEKTKKTAKKTTRQTTKQTKKKSTTAKKKTAKRQTKKKKTSR